MGARHAEASWCAIGTSLGDEARDVKPELYHQVGSAGDGESGVVAVRGPVLLALPAVPGLFCGWWICID